jgi:methionine-gamma-lyase
MSDDPVFKPQTQVLSKGYDPMLSEGAVVPPVFRTSTFAFKSCSEGKRAFEIAYGLSPAAEGEIPALIYSRVNNPNVQMVEDRLCTWDGSESCALFSSGMGAIATTCLALLRPGDGVLFANPVYGGSEYLFRHILPEFSIRTWPFPAGAPPEVVASLLEAHPEVKLLFLETPANPTMTLTDIEGMVAAARRACVSGRRVFVAVDNTFLGPLFSQPLRFGADLVLYSATKFIGGHSDVVAGAALGSRALVKQVKVFRTILGSNSDPDSAWLILRSLGTLQLRMEQQQRHALRLVELLARHPAVTQLYYPGHPMMGTEQGELFRKQCRGSGSIITFTVRGAEAEAFRVLDALRAFRLAVSLGGIESLAEHPASMTHSDMSAEEKSVAGIGGDMIRLSVGLEDPEDLVADLRAALDLVAQR